LYKAIDESFGCWPQIQLLQVYNLLNPSNDNYEGNEDNSNDEVVLLGKGYNGNI